MASRRIGLGAHATLYGCLCPQADTGLGEDFIVGLAVLCHDLGKPLCTYQDATGRIRARNTID